MCVHWMSYQSCIYDTSYVEYRDSFQTGFISVNKNEQWYPLMQIPYNNAIHGYIYMHMAKHVDTTPTMNLAVDDIIVYPPGCYLKGDI